MTGNRKCRIFGASCDVTLNACIVVLPDVLDMLILGYVVGFARAVEVRSKNAVANASIENRKA
jgi:hypothetical protein